MNTPISSICIHGFTSIKALDSLPLSNLNILIGTNGAGKSNLIEAFQIIKAEAQAGLNQYVMEHGGASSFFI